MCTSALALDSAGACMTNTLPVAVDCAQASSHVRRSSSTMHVLGCKKGAKRTITQSNDLILPILGALNCQGDWLRVGHIQRGLRLPQHSHPSCAKPRPGPPPRRPKNSTASPSGSQTIKAKSWDINITVWNACTDSHQQSEMAAMGPNALAYVTWLAKSTKHAKYSDLCTACGIQHLPAACLQRLWGLG